MKQYYWIAVQSKNFKSLHNLYLPSEQL